MNIRRDGFRRRSDSGVRDEFQWGRLLGGCAQGVKAGTAAEHYMEGLTEVAETGIADFEGGLGDVGFSGAQEFGGTLQAGVAEPLGNGETGLAGEGGGREA
jgi:hypothetical protein